MKAVPLLLVLLSTTCPTTLLAQPLMDTRFTFQGQLKHRGVPVTGQADFAFRLFDMSIGGNQIGPQIGHSFVEVFNGLFTVELDFGAAAFDGHTRWLEVEVEYPSGDGNWTTLSPRQMLTATPYALHTRGLHVNDVGEVGVGTTNPQAPLHVSSDGSRTVRVRNSAANGGTAIAAEATAGSGSTFALDAYTSSPAGSTIYAFNEAESGNAHAVQAENISPQGVAVHGYASSQSERSTGIGVLGRSRSDEGIGVSGEGTGSSGNNIGVKGHTASATGFAGYFTGGRNYFEGDVGIGLTDPAAKLHVAGGNLRVDSDLDLYQGGVLALASQTRPQGKNLSFRNTTTAGEIAAVGTSADGAGFVILRNQGGGTSTVEIDADGDDAVGAPAAGLLRLRSTGGGPGGQLTIQNDGGSTGIEALGGGAGEGGTLEMFNGVGGGTILLDADDSSDGTIRLLDASGNTGILLRADHASSVAGEVSLYNDDGFETVELLAAEGTDNGAQITVRKADGTATIQMDAEYGTDGGAYVELTGGTEQPTLYVEGGGAGRNDAALRVNNTQAVQGMAAYLTNSSTFATAHIQNDGPGETLWLENNGGGEIIVAKTPERWQFWVDGSGVTHTRDLQVHDDVKYASPRQFILNVPAYAFRVWDVDDDDVFSTNIQYGYVSSGNPIYDVSAYYALHLPDDATLQEIRVYYWDSDPDGDLSVSVTLFKRRMSDLEAQSVDYVFARSSGSPGEVQDAYEDLNTTIDNATWQYTLALSWQQGNAGFRLRLYGCRVVYSMTTLNP